MFPHLLTMAGARNLAFDAADSEQAYTVAVGHLGKRGAQGRRSGVAVRAPVES